MNVIAVELDYKVSCLICTTGESALEKDELANPAF